MNILIEIRRLFFSRHSLLFYASTIFLILGKINGDQFVWLMGLFIGANSLDKLKDNIKIGNGK